MGRYLNIESDGMEITDPRPCHSRPDNLPTVIAEVGRNPSEQFRNGFRISDGAGCLPDWQAGASGAKPALAKGQVAERQVE